MTPVHRVLIHLGVAILVIPLTWVLVWAFLPLPDPVVWPAHGNNFRPPASRAGAVINVERTFTVSRGVKVNISRLMVSKRNGETTTIELAPVVQYFEEGDYHFMRPFKIPCIAHPGNWQLVNTLTYQDVLGRERVLRPPVLDLLVTGECEGENV